MPNTTALRAWGAGVGGRYGSFAGRAAARASGEFTSLRTFGAHTGSRYGSFGGRHVTGRPADDFTGLRTFGAHTGGRYGSFAGRYAIAPPPFNLPMAIGVPRPLYEALRRGQISNDDLLLILAGTVAARLLH